VLSSAAASLDGLFEHPVRNLLSEVIWERYLNLTAFDPDGTAGDCDARIFRSFTGLDVEPPSVPWAFDDVAIQIAFSQRSSCVRTSVVHCVEQSIDIEQGNPGSLDFNRSSGPWRNVLYRRDGDKFRHSV
jgi:hypothetical protein